MDLVDRNQLWVAIVGLFVIILDILSGVFGFLLSLVERGRPPTINNDPPSLKHKKCDAKSSGIVDNV